VVTFASGAIPAPSGMSVTAEPPRGSVSASSSMAATSVVTEGFVGSVGGATAFALLLFVGSVGGALLLLLSLSSFEGASSALPGASAAASPAESPADASLD
jgi:hypothetical protein